MCTSLGLNRYFKVSFVLVFLGLGSASRVFASSGYLYVLNDGASAAPSIYGFAVDDPSGTYSPLPNFPVATSGLADTGMGNERVAIDALAGRLYVVNGGNHSVSAYAIDRSSGALSELSFSPIALPSGQWASIVVHPSGSPVAVADQYGNQVASLRILTTSAEQAVGSPYALGSTGASSSVFTPDGNYYYCGGSSGSFIAGFGVNPSTGVLTPLSGAPYDTGAFAPGQFAADGLGHLFMCNHQDFGMRAYNLQNGVPAGVSGNPFVSGLMATMTGLYHPAGFYVVDDVAGSRIGVYKVSGGGASLALTPVAGSPFTTGDGSDAYMLPTGMALTQAGTHLFVAGNHAMTLLSYPFNTNSGALGTPTVPTPQNLGALGGHLSGMAYLPPATVQTLDVKSPKIVLNFAKSDKDSITFSGSLPIPDHFAPTTTPIFVDAGGVSRSFVLNAKGDAKDGNDSINLTFKSSKGMVFAQMGKYSVSFKNGTFFPAFIDENLVNTTVTKGTRYVKFTVTLGQNVYQTTQMMSYTAKAGKTGTAH
jgi:hypothetical protein